MNKFLILSVLAAFLCFTSCNEKHEELEEEIKYVATTPLKIDTSIVKEYVSQIKSIRHIEVRALEKGYLQNFFVDEGQLVKKGQIMFQILPNIYQAEVQTAQAEVNIVDIEYKNTKKLAESGVVSANELALASAKLDKAKASLAQAKVHLDFTRITAPFEGIIDKLEVRQGSLINEGDLLTSLSDNSKMWVYFNVPEKEYLELQTSNKSGNTTNVKLKMANNEMFDQPGVVEVIEAVFNNETGNIAFRATFPNPKRLLRHGETGNIMMTVPVKNATIIPQKCAFEVLDKKYIFVIDKNDVVKTKEIKIAHTLEDVYILSTPLVATDKVLLEGIKKVKDGEKIIYDLKNPREVISKLKVYTE